MNCRTILYILPFFLLTHASPPINQTMPCHQLGQSIHQTFEKKPFYYNVHTRNEPESDVTRHTYRAPFLWGASTSAHQSAGRWCTAQTCSHARMVAQINADRTHENERIRENNGWTSTDQHATLHDMLPSPHDPEYTVDLRTYYRSYIDTAAAAGLNSLRFSVEWAQIEPQQGVFDQEALDNYANIFCYLIEKNMTPVVVFHHYTDPCWFADRGGFQKAEGIKQFTRYCRRVWRHFMVHTAQRPEIFQKIAPHIYGPASKHQLIIPLWVTFNAPEGYAFKSYYTGDLPPSATTGNKSLRKAVLMQGNVLNAHVEVYRALKSLFYDDLSNHYPTMSAPQIGIGKNVHQLDPLPAALERSWLDAQKTRLACGFGNYVQHDAVYNFFKSGVYTVPFLGIFRWNRHATGTLDFVGVNYYSNCFMDGANKLKEEDPRYTTDSHNYRIYPEGLYRALMEVWDKLAKHIDTHSAGWGMRTGPYHPIPIYVMENGIATMDDEKRSTFYPTYLEQLHRAQKEITAHNGAVLGYLPWTLCSNYEWPSLKEYHHREYGLFGIDASNPAHLLLKEGSRSYVDIVRSFADEQQQTS